MNPAHLLRLPEQLRARPQWLLAGPNEVGELKVPYSVNAEGRPYLGSSTDPDTWLDFDYALECAQELGYGMGYVISPDDPYTCIDFDLYTAANKPNNPEKWSSPEDFDLCQRIANTMQSYLELSQSGIGAHCWLIGKVPHGLQEGPVALYSHSRFIACTGKVVMDLPMADRQDILSNMAAQIESRRQQRAQVLDDGEEEISDNEVMQRAWNADNSTKFRALWDGDWVNMGYPSQSEADLSLMSMLTFYSRNNEQCRRLFRQCKLGFRDKAVKDDRYLDYTLRLIRGRQAKEDAEADRIKVQSQAFAATLTQPTEAMRQAAATLAAQLQASHSPAGAALPPAQPPQPPQPPDGGLPWPPGRVGELAQFIYGSAPRPVKEVAIVAALGWFAGVCGKAWNIPGSGLNLYIILVARSAVGKEAMHSGLGAFIHRLRLGSPAADHFINFNDFASGPALAKACAEQSSFVNISGEWGRKLKGIATDTASGPMQSLRTVMTNLYQKSGPASIVGGISYSNKESNVASISGVSFSMIGETTPDTLYASLTESMMEDGFLSRFCIVEYTGQRPPANPYQNMIPPNELVQYAQEMCVAAVNLIGSHTRSQVQRDVDAARLMDAFDVECDAQINSTTDESWRQMWNRAHLKMARVAALLACSVNYHEPVVTGEHVTWALDLVRRDIAIMRKRLETGDVGAGDSAREKKLLHIMHEYLTQPTPTSYGVPAQMPRDGVVPRKYLQMRSAQVAAFRNHSYGATRALDDAINSLCNSGYIAEMDKVKAGEAYTYQGRCFRIVQLPKFN